MNLEIMLNIKLNIKLKLDVKLSRKPNTLQYLPQTWLHTAPTICRRTTFGADCPAGVRKKHYWRPGPTVVVGRIPDTCSGIRTKPQSCCESLPYILAAVVILTS